MSVIVKHSESVTDTPAYALITEGWAELANAVLLGSGNAMPPYCEQSEAIYAVSPDGDVVGAIVFHTRRGYVDVQLFFVEETSRRSGVFSRMLTELRNRMLAVSTRVLRKLYMPVGSADYMRAVILAHGFSKVKNTQDSYEVQQHV